MASFPPFSSSFAPRCDFAHGAEELAQHQALRGVSNPAELAHHQATPLYPATVIQVHATNTCAPLPPCSRARGGVTQGPPPPFFLNSPYSPADGRLPPRRQLVESRGLALAPVAPAAPVAAGAPAPSRGHSGQGRVPHHRNARPVWLRHRHRGDTVAANSAHRQFATERRGGGVNQSLFSESGRLRNGVQKRIKKGRWSFFGAFATVTASTARHRLSPPSFTPSRRVPGNSRGTLSRSARCAT